MAEVGGASSSSPNNDAAGLAAGAGGLAAGAGAGDLAAALGGPNGFESSSSSPKSDADALGGGACLGGNGLAEVGGASSSSSLNMDLACVEACCCALAEVCVGCSEASGSLSSAALVVFPPLLSF